MLILGLYRIIQLKHAQPSPSTTYTIGILQTASHPSLNAVCEGFISTLQKTLHNNITFIVQNAEGSIANAHAIAQRFHANESMDIIFAIAMPAAQAIAAIEKEKPILLAALTNPTSSNILTPNNNTTGNLDIIDEAKFISLLQEILPSTKTVALVYDKDEICSKLSAEKLIMHLNNIGMETIKICVNSKAIFNTAIVTNNLLINYSPFDVCIDYFENGAQNARMALAILQHKKHYQLPLQHAINKITFLHKKTLETLKLVIPEEIINQVDLFEECSTC